MKLKKKSIKKKDPSQPRLAHQNLDWFPINSNIKK
jgi:hypothetical protein